MNERWQRSQFFSAYPNFSQRTFHNQNIREASGPSVVVKIPNLNIFVFSQDEHFERQKHTVKPSLIINFFFKNQRRPRLEHYGTVQHLQSPRTEIYPRNPELPSAGSVIFNRFQLHHPRIAAQHLPLKYGIALISLFQYFFLSLSFCKNVNATGDLGCHLLPQRANRCQFEFMKANVHNMSFQHSTNLNVFENYLHNFYNNYGLNKYSKITC